MDLNEFFKLLGVMPNASVDEVKKAYKKKAKETHPDVGGDKDKFLMVQHAYKMITDPKYRYDSGPQKERRLNKDLELRLNITVAFEDAFFGRTVRVNYNRPVKGKSSSELEILRIEEEVSPGSQATREFVKKGYGIKDGDRVGDALITLRFDQSPKFRLQNLDVIFECPVPLKVLLGGGEVEVETMWGVETIQVKPASSPGDTVLLPNKGVARQGSQIVVLGLVYPKKEEFKADEFWKDTIEIDY